jgi:hypothetical protein
MVGRAVTTEEHVEIVRLWDTHGRIGKVARLVERAPRTVHEQLVIAGRRAPSRPQALSDAAIEQIATIYSTRSTRRPVSILAVARQYALPPETTRRALLYAGVSLRPAGTVAARTRRDQLAYLATAAPVLQRPVRAVSLDYGGVPDPRGGHRGGHRDAHATYPLDPDVPGTLHALRDLGLLALVASDVRTGQDRTAALAEARLLAAVLQSEDLGYDRSTRKADPRFFATVIETAGFPAAQILHVDTCLPGIARALWAGMDAVLVAPGGRRPHGLPPRTPVIPHIRDLPDLLVSTGRADPSGHAETLPDGAR